VNTLVVTPGNYTFGDFLRVGVPFQEHHPPRINPP
jgi:di/tricarboxylate transporter